MPILSTDFVSINRGGTPGNAASGTYFVSTVQGIIDLAVAAGGDGVVTGVSLVGTNLVVTRSGGLPNLTADLSSLAGGASGTLVNNLDGTYSYADGVNPTVVIDTRAASNPYDNTASGLVATDVQAAIDALVAQLATKSGAISVSDEGVALTSGLASVNFTGAGVTATTIGGAVTVNVPGGGGGSVTVDGVSVFDDAGTLEGPWQETAIGLRDVVGVNNNTRGVDAIHNSNPASYPYTYVAPHPLAGTTITQPGQFSTSSPLVSSTRRAIASATGSSIVGSYVSSSGHAVASGTGASIAASLISSAGHAIASGDGTSIVGAYVRSSGSVLATGIGSNIIGAYTNSNYTLISSGQASTLFGGDTGSGVLEASGDGTFLFGAGVATTAAQDDSFIAVVGKGNVGFGTNAPTEKLHVQGNILASGIIFLSDRRLKDNIAGDDGEWVLKLAPKTFNMKVETLSAASMFNAPVAPTEEAVKLYEEATDKAAADYEALHPKALYAADLERYNELVASENTRAEKEAAVLKHGFIAQEVQAVAPELVRQSGDYLGVDYVGVISGLVAVVQQLESRITALEAAVNTAPIAGKL